MSLALLGAASFFFLGASLGSRDANAAVPTPDRSAAEPADSHASSPRVVRDVPLRAPVAATVVTAPASPAPEEDLGLAQTDGLIRAIEAGGADCEQLIRVRELRDVVTSVGAAFEDLSPEQQEHLEELDRPLRQRAWNANRDAKLALYRAVRKKIEAGDDEWFPIAQAAERTRAALENSAHLDDDRIWSSGGGPRDGTSRLVQVYRWEDPDLFQLRTELLRAEANRRSALRLELDRMGVTVPRGTGSRR